jgi:hypothetical protein
VRLEATAVGEADGDAVAGADVAGVGDERERVAGLVRRPEKK